MDWRSAGAEGSKVWGAVPSASATRYSGRITASRELGSEEQGTTSICGH